MASKLAPRKRIQQLDRLLMSGLTHAQIGKKIGVCARTIRRYMAIRRERMFALIDERQPIIFDKVLRDGINDHEALGRLIKAQNKPSLFTTDAYGKRTQIRRDLLRLVGIDQQIKIQNIQNNLQLNDNRKQVSMQGPVQIIVEANGGQFDPEFGQVRMDNPSADEISSAQG